jgi:ATP-binding cassette subfamily B protein
LIRQRSSIPGRLRLDVEPMVANPALAAAVEDFVHPMERVTAVKANPISGSLLVNYDPRSAPATLPATMQAEIERWLAGARASGAERTGARPRALSSVLMTSRERPGEGIGPVLLSVGGYALTTLQGLTVGALTNVARRSSADGGSRTSGSRTARSQLKGLGAATLVLTGAELWATYSRDIAWRRFSQRAEHRLRTEVWDRILQQDMAFFDQHGTGQLMALLTGDVASIGALLEQGDAIIQSTLNILTGSVLLVRATPRLAMLAGGSVLLMLIPVRLLRERSWRAFTERAELAGSVNQRLESVLSGIVEVKSFATEDVEAQRFRELSHELAETSQRGTSLAELQTALGGHFVFGGYAVALTHGARRLLAGHIDENQFDRVTFWYPRLVAALGRIQGSRDAYLGARAAAGRLANVLASEPRIRDGATALDSRSVRGDIMVENVSFGYDLAVPVLRNVSFHLPAGQMLGIVGLSGSGKTTLLRLLLRFYHPGSGRILLDGHDLRDLRVRDLRAAIALVSQDVYLFDGTLAHNVRYGQPEATDDEVIAAITAAGAEELQHVLPQGLETEVGERGHRLSGGQRQRLAIARALLKKAPVLTLDEATSQLDAIAEAAVTTSMRASGRTVIACSHRLAGVRDADRIIVLDGGTIREQGSHQDLLDQQGLYYRLWQMQSRADGKEP